MNKLTKFALVAGAMTAIVASASAQYRDPDGFRGQRAWNNNYQDANFSLLQAKAYLDRDQFDHRHDHNAGHASFEITDALKALHHGFPRWNRDWDRDYPRINERLGPYERYQQVERLLDRAGQDLHDWDPRGRTYGPISHIDKARGFIDAALTRH